MRSCGGLFIPIQMLTPMSYSCHPKIHRQSPICIEFCSLVWTSAWPVLNFLPHLSRIAGSPSWINIPQPGYYSLSRRPSCSRSYYSLSRRHFMLQELCRASSKLSTQFLLGELLEHEAQLILIEIQSFLKEIQFFKFFDPILRSCGPLFIQIQIITSMSYSCHPKMHRQGPICIEFCSLVWTSLWPVTWGTCLSQRKARWGAKHSPSPGNKVLTPRTADTRCSGSR